MSNFSTVVNSALVALFLVVPISACDSSDSESVALESQEQEISNGLYDEFVLSVLASGNAKKAEEIKKRSISLQVWMLGEIRRRVSWSGVLSRVGEEASKEIRTALFPAKNIPSHSITLESLAVFNEKIKDYQFHLTFHRNSSEETANQIMPAEGDRTLWLKVLFTDDSYLWTSFKGIPVSLIKEVTYTTENPSLFEKAQRVENSEKVMVPFPKFDRFYSVFKVTRIQLATHMGNVLNAIGLPEASTLRNPFYKRN